MNRPTPDVPPLVGEHARLTLPVGSAGLLVNGSCLEWRAPANDRPFIVGESVEGTVVDTHDWVGRLQFGRDDGALSYAVDVYPSKLSREPAEAFTFLGRMVDDLPRDASDLGFPTDLVPRVDGLSVQPLRLEDVERIAKRAWALQLEWRRRPRWTRGRPRRVVRGGSVPDRVDWALTFDHWGRGGFPEHVASDLPVTVLPPGAAALRALWLELERQAQTLPEGEPLARRMRAARAHLPPEEPDPSQDPVSGSAHALLEHLRVMGRRSRSRPAGSASMPALYEVWAQLAVLRAQKATQGSFRRTAAGLFEGTFHGPGVTVTLNPRLGFRGVGQGQQQVMPDLLAVFDSGSAVVMDVKYRALNHVPTEQGRELNRQMLTYMGLLHAVTGVVLWPAPEHEPVREEPLPGGRARLLRLRCHPADPPAAFTQRLSALHLPGVT